jgi:hypothetical protein
VAVKRRRANGSPDELLRQQRTWERKPMAHTHVMSYPYPTAAQAGEALPVVLARLRGEEVELSCLVHCGFVAAGYALSMFLPHHSPVMSGIGGTAELEAQYREVLTHAPAGMMASERVLAAAAAGAFPWAAVLSVLMELLKSWLK